MLSRRTCEVEVSQVSPQVTCHVKDDSLGQRFNYPIYLNKKHAIQSDHLIRARKPHHVTALKQWRWTGYLRATQWRSTMRKHLQWDLQWEKGIIECPRTFTGFSRPTWLALSVSGPNLSQGRICDGDSDLGAFISLSCLPWPVSDPALICSRFGEVTVKCSCRTKAGSMTVDLYSTHNLIRTSESTEGNKLPYKYLLMSYGLVNVSPGAPRDSTSL